MYIIQERDNDYIYYPVKRQGVYNIHYRDKDYVYISQ